MIEIATLAKLLAWVSAATGVYETVKDCRPKSWTNVEARFAVEEIGLGFSCDDKSWSSVGTTVRGHTFRVSVLDPNLDIIAYMEGVTSDHACPKATINVKKFPHDLLGAMFQMARCMREFKRTDDNRFAAKYQSHRNRVVFLWQNPSKEGAMRQDFEQSIMELIAKAWVGADRVCLTLYSRLVEDLGACDSDLYTLVELLEEKFRIDLSDEGSYMWYVWYGSDPPSDILYRHPIAREWLTIGDVVDCIWNKTRS